MLSTLLSPPRTGRDLARARVILGVSARQVARLLGIHHASLLRLEQDTDAIAPDLATAWRAALATCGRARLAAARDLDLRDTELAALTAVLSQESD
jgi:transcriptional regulator with XRE-family HTH domain